MKYPVSMRLLHWAMAIIILGMIWAGWEMASMSDDSSVKFDVFFPWHKSFGMLVLFLALARLATRARSSVPPSPPGLSRWEAGAAKIAHFALYALMIIVPFMGYAMSSSYTESSGVFFFGFNLPELLPKNDERSELFGVAHRWLAYTLLGLIAVHVAGALKHRFFEPSRANDVISRMI